MTNANKVLTKYFYRFVIKIELSTCWISNISFFLKPLRCIIFQYFLVIQSVTTYTKNVFSALINPKNVCMYCNTRMVNGRNKQCNALAELGPPTKRQSQVWRCSSGLPGWVCHGSLQGTKGDLRVKGSVLQLIQLWRRA